jgi:hypothetical protein
MSLPAGNLNAEYCVVNVSSPLSWIVLQGTRMWRRGADLDGYVANFVETEQIVQMNGYTSSFVQVAFLTCLHIVNSLNAANLWSFYNYLFFSYNFSRD